MLKLILPFQDDKNATQLKMMEEKADDKGQKNCMKITIMMLTLNCLDQQPLATLLVTYAI